MFQHIIVMCECSHLKRVHLITKAQPRGPCRECNCRGFTPEARCSVPKCGHGMKAHRTGRCRECGCTTFLPKPTP